MTRNNIASAAALGALVMAAAVLLTSCGRKAKTPTLPLPQKIETFKAGQPFADQLRDSVAKDTFLALLAVELEWSDTWSDGGFQVRKISYGYTSRSPKSRVITIELNNTALTVSCPINVSFPAGPGPIFVGHELRELDLAGILLEIPDCLKIAGTNGLVDFCRNTPNTRRIVLTLSGSDTVPTWYLRGFAWDGKGPIASLTIGINARTGEVSEHTLEKTPH